MDGKIKKTILLSTEQDRKIKAFCKDNMISFSQVIRWFIDDLYMETYDTSRTALETASFKTQQFIGIFDKDKPKQKVRGDGQGGKRIVAWYKRSLQQR